MTSKILALVLSVMLSPVALADSFKLVDGNTVKTVSTTDLEKMPVASITTGTNFTPKATFTGVPFQDFLDKYGVTAKALRFFALDEYSYTVPVNELLKYHAILAYRKNGKNLPVSDMGPYVVIFPRDEHPELPRADINAKTVWMISEVKVVR
ncbi:molybdopterin-dependent oxidoreductase (plasmid) [Pantoea sp. JZ29]|uniref:molybdopterin-dependent oxidoreductase n=1 Tax=Pantoea sp. JZ29 TaxID=2654192 RepID=UPI002B490F46|nr:molybdopterin-dependent oxidoreductase [Pantoea sp. JZ29]WRH23429.1 molybdopterin-dependent oxidoreductase [Pantoea sp. JZ29]